MDRKQIWVSRKVYDKLELLAEEAELPFQEFIDEYLSRYVEKTLGVYHMNKTEVSEN